MKHRHILAILALHFFYAINISAQNNVVEFYVVSNCDSYHYGSVIAGYNNNESTIISDKGLFNVTDLTKLAYGNLPDIFKNSNDIILPQDNNIRIASLKCGNYSLYDQVKGNISANFKNSFILFINPNSNQKRIFGNIRKTIDGFILDNFYVLQGCDSENFIQPNGTLSQKVFASKKYIKYVKNDFSGEFTPEYSFDYVLKFCPQINALIFSATQTEHKRNNIKTIPLLEIYFLDNKETLYNYLKELRNSTYEEFINSQD